MQYPFTIAYNYEEGKVGCVLLQPAMGTTFTQTTRYFDPSDWELSPSKLKIYTVRDERTWNSILSYTRIKHEELRSEASK